MNTMTCPRCDGTGIIPEYAYIKDGQCFKCGGTGRVAATKHNIECAARKEAAPQRPVITLEQRITRELAKRANTGVGFYTEEQLIDMAHEDSKKQFKIDFCEYLAAHISEWVALTS